MTPLIRIVRLAAGDIDLIEYGKAKDHKGIPIFNLAVAFDKTNRIPLFYEEYPGSITDVSQFIHMVDKVMDTGRLASSWTAVISARIISATWRKESMHSSSW